jgi:xanthine dehydrogenase molybdenum-binding subunit
MAPELITIGKSEVRKDAWAKAAGTAPYIADLDLAGMRYGAVLRSPHHHAAILRLDAANARALPGVLAVLTAADVPGCLTFGPLVQDRPVLAKDEVRHMGEPVALVVAESRGAAQRALQAIAVDYRPLPAVFDPLAALEPGAPQVHPGGNLLTEYDITDGVTDGDLQAAFEQSPVAPEDTFRLPRISPAYLEPDSSAAMWNADGTLTLWVSSQKPFVDRSDVAQVLGLEEARIQVKTVNIGGAFGGKEDSGIAVLASLAAWCTRSTVIFVNDRRESFLGHPKRHPAVVRLKLGARQDGTLLALEAVIHLDTGAYASYGPAVGGLLTDVVPGAYRIPNVRVNTRVVYTHSPFSGAMRGFGAPQAHFATETMMDILAQRLGLDPLELRRRNLLQPGDRLFTGVRVTNSALSLPACVESVAAARERLRRKPAAPGEDSDGGIAVAGQGMGVGLGVRDDSKNRLEWRPDGSVLLYLGAPDLGQGLATVSEQMIAEELGLPYAQVHTAQLDSHTTPDGGVTCASRMTYLVGNSVRLAAQGLIDSLLGFAAGTLGLPRQELVYERGVLVLPGGERLPVAEFTGRAAEQGIPLLAQATSSFPYPPETTPQHLPIGMPHVMFTYAAQVARVEVDPELGTVEVTDVVAIHDVGKAINRAGVEGQIEGGVVMGLGYALYENMRLKENGRWVESFTEYLLPTAKDAPNIECVILEVPEASGPWGAKGIAEIALTPTAPAITNAVCDAVKVRVKEIPLRPEMLAR